MNLALPATIFVASFLSSWFCCRRLLTRVDRSFWWLALLVLWAAFVTVPIHLIATLQLAGMISRASIPVLALVELVLTVIVVAIDYACPASAALEFDAAPVQQPSDPIPIYLRVCIGITGIAYLLLGVNLLSSFPGGSDAVAYHLPIAVRWLQEGSLGLAASGNWRFSLPGNGEILAMVALSTGKQSLAPLFNWGACALLALSVYVLARRVTHSIRDHALVAALIALSVPTVFFQSVSAYVDLYGTAFILAAVALFVGHYSSVNTGSANGKLSAAPVLFLSAIACGISLGTKPTFYVYCGFFLLWVILTLLREKSANKKTVASLLALLTIGILLPSAFWFGRAWSSTGNPIYPMQVKIGNRVLFPGYDPSEITRVDFADKFFRSRMEWPIYPWTEWMRNPSGYFPTSYEESAGAGAAFATFVPLGLAFAVAEGWRNFRRRPAYYIALIAGLALLAIWAGLLHRMPRFGLPLWSGACVFSAPLFARIDSFYPKVARALLVVSLSVTFAISCLLPLHALAGRIVKHRWERWAVYAYPPLIDDLPAGSRVLNYTGVLDANFPLQGKALTNRVVAEFEVPGQLTKDVLSAEHIDYIVTQSKDSGANTQSFASIESLVSNKPQEYKGPGRTWYIYKVSP
jgi:hypothetical protein